MPRFFFDIRHGSELASDPEGSVHAGAHAAEMEAIEIAAVLSRDHLQDGGDALSVQLNDAAGERILTVAVAMTIDRAKRP